MRYYKIISNGLLVSAGCGGETGEEIAETEYNRIKSIIDSRPIAPDGFSYRLTADLTWELYEIPPAPADGEELTAEEALAELVEVLV